MLLRLLRFQNQTLKGIMKDTTPFNPIIIPAAAIPPTEAKVEKLAVKATRAPRIKGLRRTARKVRPHRALDPKEQAVRLVRKMSRKAKTSWKRIKGGLHARLSNLDREQLKEVLLACGLAVVTVVAILTLVKLTPVIIAILAVVGLGVAVQMWDRVRVMRVHS